MLRKTVWIGALVLAGATMACDDAAEEAPAEGEAAAGEEGGEEAAAEGAEGAEAAEGAEGAEAAAEEAPGPDAACKTLIEAIKAKKVEDVVAASTEGAADIINDKSIEGIAASLGEATCGEATVDGDSATVPATAGDVTREIPFAKVEDAWKFDAKAYAEKYPAEDKGKKKKKKKRKKKKKK